MGKYRLSKNTTARYDSLEDLRKGFGLKPNTKKTKDSEKLAAQQERFLGKCPCCHQQLNLVSETNILVCQNDKCKGIKKTSNKKDEDGNAKVFYVPFTRMLDDLGMEIAMNIFN